MSRAAFDIAVHELGTAEIYGDAHNDRIIEYHQTTSLKATSDEVPWCASFVNWCLREAGFTGTNSARARSFLNYGEPVALNDIRAGDIVVFSSRTNGASGNNPMQGHVAFFCEWRDVRKGTMNVCGGNQSNQVSITTYGIENLIGIRRPTQPITTKSST